MKGIPRVLLVLLLAFSILTPSGLVSQELAAPLEKTIMPGHSMVKYSGQYLEFTTTVPLHVKLSMLSWNRIGLSFKVHLNSQQGPPPGSTTGGQVVIYWVNFSENVYSGSPPDGEWSGILNTESGFTEK